MTVRDIGGIIESWAPKEVAWEDDNVGLQCGDGSQKVTSILVALDPTEKTVKEAENKSVQMLVTHHPLLFHPLRRIDCQTPAGRMLQHLLQSRIALYAAHTNLDASPLGTNDALADILGLTDTEVLFPQQRTMRKIVTFVPPSDVDAVADRLAQAGAGNIGKYERCSFRAEGTGTFMGGKETHPVVGLPEQFERIPEIRLEMIVPQWRLAAVVAALRRVHPYEEPAYDIYPLENLSAQYGMGMVGNLPRPVSLAAFLKVLKRQLRIPALRHSPDTGRKVSRVAACGGSGGSLLEEAIRTGADVFVTADVKYHSFHEALGRIVVIDAGHFETEHPVVATLATRLRQEFDRRKERIAVRTASSPVNPVRYV